MNNILAALLDTCLACMERAVERGDTVKAEEYANLAKQILEQAKD